MEGSSVVQRREVVEASAPVAVRQIGTHPASTTGLTGNELDVLAKAKHASENNEKRRVMAKCHCNASGLPHYHTDTEGIVNA
jgi:hypothetical protein